jgi:hypothetical protein
MVKLNFAGKSVAIDLTLRAINPGVCHATTNFLKPEILEDDL